MACASSLLAGCNRVLGPTSPDANWRVVDTAHFALHVRPGSFGERSAATLGEVLDDQYEVTLQLLQAQYGGRISGFLYNDAADAKLQAEHSGTAFPDTGAFEATVTPPLDENLFALVAHEANHVVIIGAIGRAGTYMLNEGLASALLSERHHALGRHYYYGWTKTHRSGLPALATLANDGEWNHVAQNVAYSASASFLGYLLDTAGPANLRQLYYARSGEFEQRFAQIYGRTLREAEAAWLAFCDAYPG